MSNKKLDVHIFSVSKTSWTSIFSNCVKVGCPKFENMDVIVFIVVKHGHSNL